MTGAELKKLRKLLGLSLAKASRQVEVTPRTFARWEAGNQDIPAGALKLFRILNYVKLAEVDPNAVIEVSFIAGQQEPDIPVK